MKMSKVIPAEIAVIVGRFQVPELHEAHKELIQMVVDAHPRVLIFLGLSPNKCTKNNPLDFQARKKMIEEAFPSVECFYIEDCPSDDLWSKDLDKQIDRQIGPDKRVVLYGSRDSFIRFYHGKYECVELIPDKYVSGSEIRKRIGIKVKNTPEFRAGVIWAVENQWPAVVTCVDIAIIDRQNKRVGLARKEDEELLRFIGGHSRPDIYGFDHDALRELYEEVPGIEVSAPKCIGTAMIDDWRWKKEQNKIKTVFFQVDYLFGSPKAADDIAEFHWKDIATLKKEMLVPEHAPLYDLLIESLKKEGETK